MTDTSLPPEPVEVPAWARAFGADLMTGVRDALAEQEAKLDEKYQAAPPVVVQEPHPAEAATTPETRLLAALKVDASPTVLASVDQWLIDEGYREAPAVEEPATV